MTSSLPGYRDFSATDIAPRPRQRMASDPAVIRLGTRLADAMGQAITTTSGGPWRLTLERIGEDAGELWQQTGSWFRFESKHGSMRMHAAMDHAAFSAVCEAAMGGSASEQPYEFPDRPLSGIEKHLLDHVFTSLAAETVQVLSEELATPMRQFKGSDSDDPAGTADFIIFHYLANFRGYGGEIRLTALRRELAGQFAAVVANGPGIIEQENQRKEVQRRVSAANITFAVTLQPEMMVVDDIASLSPGKLLRLSSTSSTPVVLRSSGNPVFTAMLLRTGDRLAVRIVAPADG